MTRSAFLPRPLHPGAWWLWALGLAAAASRTTNPLLLLLIVAVAAYVVAARRTDAPWARSFGMFLRLGLVVIGLRLAFHVVFGSPVEGSTVLVALPEVPLPDWAVGVRIGGPVSVEGLVTAAYDGLRLATLLACVGAASALVSPTRLLRCVPAALYEAGVAVVVATSLAPQLVQNVGRVRAARRLRGRADRGLRALRGVGLPVLEGALERSLDLAAAMDSRGYGRRAQVSAVRRRTTAALTLAGLLGACVGVYGLLDGGSPPVLGLPVLATGAAVAATGLALAGARSVRTRYRPDPWALPEWLVAASGVAAASALLAAGLLGFATVTPSTQPLEWPALPLLPAAGILLGVVPAWAAPPPAARGPRLPSPRRERVAA